jgi:hypothetical protein
MHFRFAGTVRGFLLQTGHSPEIKCGGPHAVVVQLRCATEEEVRSGHAERTTFCIVRSQWEISAKNREAFDSLARRQLPDGWQRVEGWDLQVDEQGRFRGVSIVWLELLPPAFQDFARQVNRELTEKARRIIGLVRWRQNQPGPHNPLGQVSFMWSADGVAWNHMPQSFMVISEVIRGIRTDQGLAGEIERLVSEVGDEPVGHKLFREAWENRASDRRSSLLIGIAAAEVGFKDFVVGLVPDAQWVVENCPSPPLVTMLREYLPLLPAKGTIARKVIAPPKVEILDVLTKGVQLRNKVTHASASEPRYETLEEVLLAVRDVLWLLDYYRGFTWALDNIREEVRRELGVAASS